jgi:hypothetical protein
MAERPDSRKPRDAVFWDGSAYSLPEGGDESAALELLAHPVSPYPLLESASAEPPASPADDPAPDASRSPGLYDLPSLLARIWSVPAAARLAQSGSFRTAPIARPPEGPHESSAHLDPDGPHHRSPAPLSGWPPPGFGAEPSLPLAAVPSLTLSAPAPARPEPSPLTEPAAAEPFYSTGIQYIAWRHPPCRQGYGAPLPRGLHCLRGLPSSGSGVDLVPVAGRDRPVHSEWMMRPASTSWTLRRFELPVSSES